MNIPNNINFQVKSSLNAVCLFLFCFFFYIYYFVVMNKLLFISVPKKGELDPMDQHASVISLLIVVTAAFVTPIILHRLKLAFIPVVVAEILMGLIIGKSGF